MKGKKIIIISIIINILTIGIIYNLIKKDYFDNEKIIVKAMTEAEYEDNIKSLNTSHEEYAKYVEESKKKIASAITDMGVITSSEATPETMSSNIRSIARNSEMIELWRNSSYFDDTWTRSYYEDYASIPLNLSDYKYVVITYEYGLTDRSCPVTTFIEVGKGGWCFASSSFPTTSNSGTFPTNYKYAEVTTTGINFTISNDNRCIPILVYGIK